jgi:hypothetical protein
MKHASPSTHPFRSRIFRSASQFRRKNRFAAAGFLLVGLFILALVFASPLLTNSAAASKRSERESNPVFTPTDGTITIKSGNYIGPSTTETAKFSKQVFSSTDCSTGGGSIDMVTGVDSTTGISFTLGSSSSVLLTIPDSGLYFSRVSEQNGPFVGVQTADVSYFSSIISQNSTDGHVCIQGFDGPGTRLYFAQFYAGIQLFDSCGTEVFSYRPGDTVTIKVTGGLLNSPNPYRLIAAGGSPSECTFLPGLGPFINVTSDPFTYNYTLPASDADILGGCSTTSILGQWRAVAYDPNCGCNRNDLKFTLASDAPLPSCSTLTCPTDISVSNDAGSCGAIVTYTTPTATSPATVSCDHPSGSTFPVGATLVTCTSSAGPTCSFNVTVNDAENPTITAPAGFTIGTDSNSCVATGVALGTPTTHDNCLVTSVGNNAPASFLLGSTTVTWTVNDNHGHSATASQVITVVDNVAPALSVPADSSAPANASCQAAIPDAVAGSSASDNCGGVTITQSPIAGTLVGAGLHSINVTAKDTAGNETTKVVHFNVIDNSPPTIILNDNLIALWPPNHQYETVQVTDLIAGASDNCDATVSLASVYISQVTSDEVENGNGDGNTLNDIVIASDCRSVQLRAEREGGANGRVYVITFKVRDASGNSTTATAQVTVPKSQDDSPAINDGPHYIVNSGCP